MDLVPTANAPNNETGQANGSVMIWSLFGPDKEHRAAGWPKGQAEGSIHPQGALALRATESHKAAPRGGRGVRRAPQCPPSLNGG